MPRAGGILMTRFSANVLLLVTGALWGGGFVAQSKGMASIGPLSFIGLRFAIAALAVLPFALWESRRAPEPLERRNWSPFVWIGLAMFAGSVAQQIGLTATSVSNSGFLTSLYVIMVPLLGIAFFRSPPHWVVWPAATAALTGVYLLSGGATGALNAGDLDTILCAGFWAIQIVLVGKYASRTGRPLTLAFTQFAVTGALGLAAGLCTERIDQAAIWAAAPSILYAGLIAGALAFTLQMVAQRATTSSNAAIMLASEAPFAALFGALFLGERLSPVALCGGALIVAAMVAVELVPQWNGRKLAPVAER